MFLFLLVNSATNLLLEWLTSKTSPTCPKSTERKNAKLRFPPLLCFLCATHVCPTREPNCYCPAPGKLSGYCDVRRLWWIFGACQAGTSSPPPHAPGGEGGRLVDLPRSTYIPPPHTQPMYPSICLFALAIGFPSVTSGGGGGGSGRGNSGVEIEGGGRICVDYKMYD
jgi:hypothetical protein